MKTVLYFSALLSSLALDAVAEPLVKVDRERIIEICHDAIVGKYDGVQQATISFISLEYTVDSHDDEIITVKFMVPIAPTSDPKFLRKNLVAVELLPSGGIFGVQSMQEKHDELMSSLESAKQAAERHKSKKPSKPQD